MDSKRTQDLEKKYDLNCKIFSHKELIEECKNQSEMQGTDVLSIGVSIGYGDGYFSLIRVENFIKFLESEIIEYEKQLKEINKQLEVENE